MSSVLYNVARRALFTLGLLGAQIGGVSAQDITPNPGSASAPAYRSGESVYFEITHPVDLLPATYNLSCDYTAPLTACSPTESSVFMQPGETRMVFVTYATGAPGAGTLTLILNGGSASAWYDITVYDSRGPAILTHGTDGRYRVPSICVLACADAIVSYSTPAYTSLDVPRSVTLSYNSGTIAPRGFVHVIATDTSSVPSTKVSLRLQDASQAWVTFTNGSTELFYGSGAGQSHLAGQFSLPTSATGAHTYTTVVTSHWSDGATRTASGSAVITALNDADSPYGAGWRIVGLSRLYFSGQNVLMADGAGGVILAPFSHCSGGTCFYTLPAWEYGQLSKRPSPGPNGVLYDRALPNGSIARFDTAGLLKETQDRYGNTTTYSHDTSLRLTSVTDPAGKVTTLAYRVSGAGGWKVGTLESITTPGGRVSWFFVDTPGDLVRIDDPDGVTGFTATYDAQHRLLSRTGRRGDNWKVAYDFAGTVAADSTPPFAVVGTQNPVRLAARLRSLKVDVLVDPASGQGSSANPASRRPSDSVRVEATDTRGFTTSYAVNHFGVATRIASALDGVTVLDRADAYHVSRHIGPTGDTLDMTVEYPGNVRSVLHRNTGGRADYVYDATQFHQLARAYGNAVDSAWNYFGVNGNVDSTRVGDASRKVTKYTYDTRGRVISVTDMSGHLTTSYPAASGWMNTDSVRSGGRLARRIFDSYGRTSKTIAANGMADSTVYDLLNRVRSHHAPHGYTMGYTYGSSTSVPDSVIDPKGQIYQFYPNALGWTERQLDPLGQEERFGFDSAGNVSEWTNRRSQVTRFVYNHRGEVVERRLHDGRITTYTHSADGKSVGSTNAEGTYSRDLGDGSLVYRVHETATRSGVPLRGVVVSDSIVSEVTKVEIIDATTTLRAYTIRRDNRGLITEIGTSPVVTMLGRDDEGRLVCGSALGRGFGYRAGHALASGSYNPNVGGGQPFGSTMVHDLVGRLTERRNAAADTLRTFAYDSLGRLTTARDIVTNGTPCPAINLNVEVDQRCSDLSGLTTVRQFDYSYDQAGNPLQATVGTGNRLIKLGQDSLTYDQDGNVTQMFQSGALTRTLYWNSINQLDSVIVVGVGTISFGYDGFGRRVRKSTPSGTTLYLNLGDQLIAEYDMTGTILRSYMYYPGVDRPFAVQTATNSYYYLDDGRGNVTGLADAANPDQIVARYSYTPFGEELSSSGTVDNPLRFAGRELDSETGLYYNRARYYHPKYGRFISEDPIGLAGGINPYLYAAADPVNWADPSGLFRCTITELTVRHALPDEGSPDREHDHGYTAEYQLRECLRALEALFRLDWEAGQRVINSLSGWLFPAADQFWVTGEGGAALVDEAKRRDIVVRFRDLRVLRGCPAGPLEVGPRTAEYGSGWSTFSIIVIEHSGWWPPGRFRTIGRQHYTGFIKFWDDKYTFVHAQISGEVNCITGGGEMRGSYLVP